MAGRIGNFINGELWGRAADPALPWAMIFPQVDTVPRHPSQLYQAGMEGLLLFVILWLYSSQLRPPRAVSGVFLIGYGVFRWIGEYFREPDAGIFGHSSSVQSSRHPANRHRRPDKQRLQTAVGRHAGLQITGNFVSERENVDEDICAMGSGPFKVEVDLMQPLDPDKKPAVHTTPLNHVGLWIDDLPKAVEWLTAQGVRFAPGGIRKGAAGHDITFLHPKGSDEFPIGGEGVLIELVQAPPEVVQDRSGAISSRGSAFAWSCSHGKGAACGSDGPARPRCCPVCQGLHQPPRARYLGGSPCLCSGSGRGGPGGSAPRRTESGVYRRARTHRRCYRTGIPF
jgi:lactoylglutathione lyase